MMKDGSSRLGSLNIDLSISLQHQQHRPAVQLDLMPCAPASKSSGFSAWQSIFQRSATESNSRGIDVNQVPSAQDVEEDEQIPITSSSPNNSASFQLGNTKLLKRERDSSGNFNEDKCEITSSRASDEEEGATRKKLRLTKDQSALLEDSFREHSTLNPKQKNALAKQLNLRPRQVEVWFQNRRARTKLKQTEVDCELLKRCCEGLTEENRRLQKELQELRALKVSPPCVITHDFYMPLPATSLTMCPSCERLASAADHNTNTNNSMSSGSTISNITTIASRGQQHHHLVTSPNSKQGLVKYLTT